MLLRIYKLKYFCDSFCNFIADLPGLRTLAVSVRLQEDQDHQPREAGAEGAPGRRQQEDQSAGSFG